MDIKSWNQIKTYIPFFPFSSSLHAQWGENVIKLLSKNFFCCCCHCSTPKFRLINCYTESLYSCNNQKNHIKFYLGFIKTVWKILSNSIRLLFIVEKYKITRHFTSFICQEYQSTFLAKFNDPYHSFLYVEQWNVPKSNKHYHRNYYCIISEKKESVKKSVFSFFEIR